MPPMPDTNAILRASHLRALVAEGYSLRAIALKIGKSPTQAARLVKALGLTVRKVKPARGGEIGFSTARAAGAVGHAETRHGPDGTGATATPLIRRKGGGS